MVSIYDIFMAPLEKIGIGNARNKLLKEAFGNILEIGAGTGVNIKYYNYELIESIIMSDVEFDKRLIKRVNESKYNTKIKMKVLTTLDLPFKDNTFDFVINTLVFCSVSDVDKGLNEIKRVLKPDGTLIFIEHIIPEKSFLKKVFNYITPTWKKIAMGCHLNRDFIFSLRKNGFNVIHSKKFMRTVFVSGKAKPIK